MGSPAGKAIAALEGHGGSVRSLAFAPDGRMLASGGADRTLKLWDVAGRRERFSLRGPNGVIRAVGFSSDGAVVAAASLPAPAADPDLNGNWLICSEFAQGTAP